jgi:hypothetical protein
VKPVKLKQLQFQMMLTQTWDGMNLAHVDQVASSRSAMAFLNSQFLAQISSRYA